LSVTATIGDLSAASASFESLVYAGVRLLSPARMRSREMFSPSMRKVTGSYRSGAAAATDRVCAPAADAATANAIAAIGRTMPGDVARRPPEIRRAEFLTIVIYR